MADPKSEASDAEQAAPEESAVQNEEIRGRVRELTSQVLKGSPLDPKGVAEIVRTMTAGAVSGTAVQPPSTESKQALLDKLQTLDQELMRSAQAAHEALEQLGSKGIDFTENDLKETFAMLHDLQAAYVNTVDSVASVATGNIQRELRELAGHAQQVGVDTGARVATVVTEFANRLNVSSRQNTASGFGTALDYSRRMSMLGSGVLAGIADALKEQSGSQENE